MRSTSIPPTDGAAGGAAAGAGSSRVRLWSWVLSILLAAVLLYFSIRGVDWRQVGRTIADAQWRYIALATAITSGSYFLRSLRWRILLNAEAWFSVSTVFWANMAGYLGNNFLPARAGEWIRSYLIGRQSSLSTTYVLTTALGERLMDVIALVLASSLVLLGMDAKPQWMESLSRTMAIAAGAGAIAILLVPHTGNLVERILRSLPLPGRLRDLLLRLAGQVLQGLRAFHSWGRMAGFVLLTAAIWTADAFAVITSAQALGIGLSFRVAMLLLTGLGLGSALPSTPGYVGIYQFVAVMVLMPFGVSRDAALAYILMVQASGYVVVLALGLPGFYRMRGVKAPAQ